MTLTMQPTPSSSQSAPFNMRRFGRKLQDVRMCKGLTQEQLAQELNVSRQAIAKWENAHGMPDIANLVQLAIFFEVTLDYLLLGA